MTSTESNTREISFQQALQVWWGVTWRQTVITMVVSFGACVALAPFHAGEPELFPQAIRQSHVLDLIGAVVSAVILMIAIRQALVADYATFSFTVLEAGSEEPGRLHAALGERRLLKIWWAMTWPLYLSLYGGLPAAVWLSGISSPGTRPEPSAVTCGVLVGLLTAWFGLSIVLLWRALRKHYRDFRLVALLPWSAQIRE